MKYRTLGKTGYRVSEIGLGCWQFGGDFGPISETTSHDVIKLASARGVNLFDTADVYGAGVSESYLGNYFSSQNNAKPHLLTKVGRDGKLFPDGYTKKAVRDNIEESLKRLKVDTLDLIQLHCVPPAILAQGDIFAWLDDFCQEGLIRHYGVSVETVDEALLCLEQPKLATLQIIFNIFRQDAISRLFDKALEADVGIIVRLPLASGLLSGNMKSQQVFDKQDHRNFNRNGECFNVGETFSGIEFEKGIALVNELKQIVGTGMPLSQLALRWILDFPAVSTVIAGASKPEQVMLNTGVSDIEPLSTELHQQLSDFYKNRVRENIRGDI